MRGEEIRVWELEGRGGGPSIEVRPTTTTTTTTAAAADASELMNEGDGKGAVLREEDTFDERRNWVGFDDEMVIVLKESRAQESLMVYDFT